MKFNGKKFKVDLTKHVRYYISAWRNPFIQIAEYIYDNDEIDGMRDIKHLAWTNKITEIRDIITGKILPKIAEDYAMYIDVDTIYGASDIRYEAYDMIYGYSKMTDKEKAKFNLDSPSVYLRIPYDDVKHRFDFNEAYVSVEVVADGATTEKYIPVHFTPSEVKTVTETVIDGIANDIDNALNDKDNGWDLWDDTDDDFYDDDDTDDDFDYD